MVAFTRGAHMHTECTICGDIRMVIQDGLKLESEEKTNLCCVFFLFFPLLLLAFRPSTPTMSTTSRTA